MHELASESETVIEEPPSHFGRYTVVRKLGEGGMAHVYEGRHPDLQNRVALKVMQRVLAVQQLAAARFLREAKTAAQVRHPNVVQVFDIGSQDGLPFIVMEFLEGIDLAKWLEEKGPLPIGTIVDLFLPLFSAVANAHAAGITHRDLKPANVMITKRPPHAVHPVILDFGISKIANSAQENTFTRSDSLLGTVHYMAPELTRGAKFATAASDQYALGVMLYECATGQRPFNGASQYELMHAIVTAPVPPPSAIAPGISAEFDALVQKAMHRIPSERFSSVTELGNALLSFGDVTAWKLWKSEFMVQSRAGGPLTVQRTLADVRQSSSRRHESLVSASAPARRARDSRWLFLAFGFCALATILAAWRRPWRPPAEATPSGPSAIASPLDTSLGTDSMHAAPSLLSATPRSPEPVADGSRATTEGQPPSAVPTTRATSSPSAGVPNARSHKMRTTEPTQPSGNETRRTSPASSLEPRPSLARGSNGALIVE